MVKRARAQDQTEPDTPRDEETPDGSNPFIRAHAERTNARQKVCVEEEERRRKAYFDCWSRQQALRAEAWEKVLEAYRALLIAQARAGARSEEWAAYRDAQMAFTRAQREYFFGAELRNKLAEINEEYRKHETESSKRLHKLLADVEVEYLRVLKDAIDELDDRAVEQPVICSMKMAVAALDGSAWALP